MSAGKFALLLLGGSIAGAAFATIITGTLPSYSRTDHSRQISADSPLPVRSWLEQGVSALNSPAWPFGHGDTDQPTAPPRDGYAPYGYGPADDYDDNTWERRQYGERDLMPVPEAAYASAGAPAQPDQSTHEPAQDAAAAAAARAADAAQDVTAAENAP